MTLPQKLELRYFMAKNNFPQIVPECVYFNHDSVSANEQW